MTLGLSLLVLAALFMRGMARPRAAAPSRPGESSGLLANCVINGPATFIEAGRVWCRAAAAGVTINTDTRNYSADITLPASGVSGATVDEFRRLTDAMAVTTQMNVRVAIRDSGGGILAMCSRDLLHNAAACSAAQ